VVVVVVVVVVAVVVGISLCVFSGGIKRRERVKRREVV
jgi:Tfp pilus assembly protein FimT